MLASDVIIEVTEIGRTSAELNFFEIRIAFVV